MAEVAQILACQSIASSGTASPALALPAGCQEVIVQVAAEYAAVAATSGIAVAFDISYNSGSTYAASAHAGMTVAPAAGVLGTGVTVLRFQNDPFRVDAATPTNLKIALTNDDATNAANVAVVVQALTHQA